MKIQHYTEVDAVERAPGVTVRTVIGTNEEAPNFAMRVISLAQGASPSYHSHPWEHEVFILFGEGQLRTEDGEVELGKGNIIFIEPNEPHEFSNIGNQPLQFICLVPIGASEKPYPGK